MFLKVIVALSVGLIATILKVVHEKHQKSQMLNFELSNIQFTLFIEDKPLVFYQNANITTLYNNSIQFCSENGSLFGYELHNVGDCVDPIISAIQLIRQQSMNQNEIIWSLNLKTKHLEARLSDIVEPIDINKEIENNNENSIINVERVSLEINGKSYGFEFSLDADLIGSIEKLSKEFCLSKSIEFQIIENKIDLDENDLKKIEKRCIHPLIIALTERVYDKFPSIEKLDEKNQL